MNCLILLLKYDILGHFCKVVTHSSIIFNKKRRDVLYFIGAKQKYTFERDCGCFAYNSSSLFPSSGLHQTLQLRRHVTQYSIRSPLSEFTLTSYSPPRVGYRTAFQKIDYYLHYVGSMIFEISFLSGIIHVFMSLINRLLVLILVWMYHISLFEPMLLAAIITKYQYPSCVK